MYFCAICTFSIDSRFMRCFTQTMMNKVIEKHQWKSIKTLSSMFSHLSFFEQNGVKPDQVSQQGRLLSLVDPQTSKKTQTLVFFYGIDCIFNIQGENIRLKTEVKMEPIFVENSSKKQVVVKIVFHLQGKMVQLHSTKNGQMEEIYEQLKKIVSVKGFNEYFKPLKRLGRGAFATVYLVQSKATGYKLAAKVFSKEGHKIGYKGKQSLEKQIEYLKVLSDPNIIRFDGIYETQNLIYVVTEYLSGGNLTQFRRANSLNMGQHLIPIITDILKALQYLKTNKIMHRDIKPENVVLRKEDNSWVLVDFGIATNCDEPLLYSQCGTRGYMAPEVEDESIPPKPYSQPCDMYSFGVICYQLIFGYLPFKVQMENISDVKVIWRGITKQDCQQLHPEIVKFLKGLLEFDPQIRWTPQQCLNSQLLKNPEVVDSWREYSEKKKNESYDKILKVKHKN